ncbi:AEC family transporter [Ovoidimarina sediminis]|uniref:AEC family transporter n=1 Tax=Ovoidimarina sediminis TaxID=3079856 RepID=UPI00290F37FC|nr:AEC family transporter [Rhodophyticola sp. MJ-SS7]MDU8943803.1 AEC family transporter [Rhodophyticola sp. MJ-SS7]
MNVALTVLEIVAPIFLLGLVGFAWVRLGFEYRIEFITRFAMKLGVPCLIFTALMKTEIDPAALRALSLATLVAYGIVALAATALVAGLRLDMPTYLSPIIFGNTGNIGLPLALFAFGAEGLGYAVVVLAIMAVMNFTVGLWIVAGGGNPLWVAKEPMVAATLLGLLFLWQGWETPAFLTNTLDLIGQTAIPLMLITLGVAVARLSPGRFGQSLWLSLAKALICLPAAWGTGVWFGLAPVPFAVLVLQVTTPVAVTSYLLAEKYDADADAVAGLVVVSTLLSVGLIPLILAFVI